MKTAFLLASLALATTVSQAAEWSDTSISYRYGSQFGEPGIAEDVAKNIVSLTHVSGYKYGSTFFNLDVLKSNSKDPANNSTEGAQEVYLAFNHQLSLAKTTGVKMQVGPLKDLALSTGFDYSSKNTEFAPAVRKIMVGPTAKLAFLGGWADLSLLCYKETNHNGIVGKKVSFDATPRLAAAWAFPVVVGPLDLNFNGWGTFTGSKGLDGFGVNTKPETWINSFLMADVGTFVGKPRTLQVGVGYEYIVNKFGNDPSVTPGTRTSTAMFKAELHF